MEFVFSMFVAEKTESMGPDLQTTQLRGSQTDIQVQVSCGASLFLPYLASVLEGAWAIPRATQKLFHLGEEPR